MTFGVEPDDLDAYSRQVGRAAEDVGEALAYLSKHCNLSDLEEGPISTIAFGSHSAVYGEVQKALKKLKSILSASEMELKRSASHYRRTDGEQAAKMDATYPKSRR